MNKFTKHLLPFSLLGAMCVPATSAVAESIAMPSGSNEMSAARSIAKPEKGMSKKQVSNAFGEPESRHGPTGEPAIYYWEYPNFTVYFESDYVIHAVSKQK